MGEYYPSRDYEEEQRAIAERCLTEVDNLNRLRLPDGSHAQETLEGEHVNLLTAVKEAAMPYAVSTTYQEYRDGTFWWLDQTPSQVAASGYKFHNHPVALERVDVEVAEAEDTDRSLRPGFIKVFISPKMSKIDAPYEIAKQEHLGDDDMVRIHMLDVDEKQQTRGKFMQSVLVRDVPLKAWVAMLGDPQNLFGKSIEVEDELSALSVMKVYQELEVPEDRLPEGVVSLVEAVLPYIDPDERSKVEAQLELFRTNQKDMHQKAHNIADRWLGFEVALADSLAQGRATAEVEMFVFQLSHEWGDEMLRLIDMHRLDDGGIFMSRELAAKVEEARQNTLWTSAAVITNNQRVLSQIDQSAAQVIYHNEMLIKVMMHEGYQAKEIAAVEVHSNKTVARQNVQVGGGCAGNNSGSFRGNSDNTPDESRQKSSEADKGDNWESNKSSRKWKTGVCRVEKCPSRPRQTKVGPCSVCAGCQHIFDKGGHPDQAYAKLKREPALADRT